MSADLGGALSKDGTPRRSPILTPEQAAQNEKTRIRNRNALRKTVEVNFDLGLRAHLSRLFWRNSKVTAAAAAAAAEVAGAAEALAVAEEDVAAFREKQAKPQAPKLTCKFMCVRAYLAALVSQSVSHPVSCVYVRS